MSYEALSFREGPAVALVLGQARPWRFRVALTTFVSAVFLGAFLIFQIQPLIGKYILPWYGGATSVWTACLLVFQSLLFAGYAYAHLISKWTLRRQTMLHFSLLAAALLVSIVPGEQWKPEGGDNPLLMIVAMLAVTVGLPYFVLAATGPLLQSWFYRAYSNRSPYPLYACSNAGSLLALLTYPFLIEPHLSGLEQAAVWRVTLATAALFFVAAAWITGACERRAPRPARPREATKAAEQRLSTIAWSAGSVVMFMAVTNQLTLNVAAIPFLWILPLAIYLLTFILAFGGARFYPRTLFGALFVLAVGALCWMLQAEVAFSRDNLPMLPIAWQLVIYATALFVICLVCHGELYRLRPPASGLTSFYLAIAFGGMLGGLVVGLLAPAVFQLHQELHVGMLGCSVLYVATRLRSSGGGARWVAAVVALCALGLFLAGQTRALLDGAVTTQRNFYGVVRVQESRVDEPLGHTLMLFDGSTLHGSQKLHPDLQRFPTLYYAQRTGIGRVFGALRAAPPRRVGVVGLGAGTLAAYGRPGDHFRFYEINPNVVNVAHSEFRYLGNSAAECEVALGDARLSLEREADQGFDILVLDAFSSDSIPVHLLTGEAFSIYDRHLRREGALAVHVSNLHLDLAPIVYGLAAERGFQVLEMLVKAGDDPLAFDSSWMILSRDVAFLRHLAEESEPARQSGEVLLANRPHERYRAIRIWTDNYSNLVQILR